MPYELGVDLGTTFTAAAVRNGGEPTMVGLGDRALQVPSVLLRTADGFVVGESAERRGGAEPRRLVREFKRRLGDPVPVLVDGVPFSAEMLSATLLRWVVDAVTRRQGEAPAALVLTHPASWSDYKLDVLRQVVVLAEVGTARWCSEPAAAAAQYASRARVGVGERLGVYDLGGGTFDACVLEKTEDGFVTLGTAEGVERLGGVDFDEAVFEHVRSALGARLPAVDPDDAEVTAALARLRRECVEAKEALSVDAESTVRVAVPGLHTTVRLTRAELERMIAPAIEQTMAATDRAIRGAGLVPADLSGIVLVGGSSRIPLVGEVLEQRFGVPTALDTHPKHDVALGALRSSPSAPHTPPPAKAAPAGADPAGAARPAHAATPPAPVVAPMPVTRPGVPVPGSTRGRVLAGAGVLVLVLAVAAVVVVPRLVRGTVAEPGRAGPVATAASSADSASTAAPTVPPVATIALPQSAPLGDDQLLVSIEEGGNTDLYLASTQSPGPVRRLTRSSQVDSYPVVSPDRRSVIYQRVDASGKRSLRVAGAADGSGDRPLTASVPEPCRARMGRPAWNPAAPDVLAVVCVGAAGDIGLYRMRTDGTIVSKVPLPGLSVGDPTFSPDGSRLAFWSAAREDWNAGDIYVVASDGTGETTRLTTSTRPTQYADPAFSPDGRTLAIRQRDAGATPDGDAHVYALAADGSGSPTPLAVTTGADEQDPSYSPRGDQIAYLSDRAAPGLPGGRTPRVWVMGPDGSDPHVLLTRDAAPGQTSVSWTPR